MLFTFCCKLSNRWRYYALHDWNALHAFWMIYVISAIVLSQACHFISLESSWCAQIAILPLSWRIFKYINTYEIEESFGRAPSDSFSMTNHKSVYSFSFSESAQNTFRSHPHPPEKVEPLHVPERLGDHRALLGSESHLLNIFLTFLRAFFFFVRWGKPKEGRESFG